MSTLAMMYRQLGRSKEARGINRVDLEATAKCPVRPGIDVHSKVAYRIGMGDHGFATPQEYGPIHCQMGSARTTSRTIPLDW
jgi:hypothetical protein